MSLYFALDFVPFQIIVYAILLFVLCVELVYLYAIYNRVASYARRAQSGRIGYVDSLPSVSVVVYAHAEEAAGVLQLLPELMAQQYPCYEVIVVSDGVSLEVQNAIAKYECDYPNVYQTFVPDTVYNVSRKKLGITLGIKAAKNDVVVVTDSNCRPLSDNWLYTVARNFVPGVDIVLGYTRMARNASERNWGFTPFDRVLFSMRYISYALMRLPYMGMSGNLAYRRELFFANKGFSATLNLHFGDDDLLINQMANRVNTRVELSPDSVVESSYESTREAWNELRMRYNFTSRYLHTSSKAVFALETIVHYLFWLAVVVASYLSFPNMVGVVGVLLVVLLYLFSTWRVYHEAFKCFDERCAIILVPFYQLLRPFYSLRTVLLSKRFNKNNFTWQYLR